MCSMSNSTLTQQHARGEKWKIKLVVAAAAAAVVADKHWQNRWPSICVDLSVEIDPRIRKMGRGSSITIIIIMIIDPKKNKSKIANWLRWVMSVVA